MLGDPQDMVRMASEHGHQGQDSNLDATPVEESNFHLLPHMHCNLN